MNNLIKILNSSILKLVYFVVLIVLFFFFIYDLNILYPIFADDWDYSYVYWHPERITNIFQVFYSQGIHYVKWGGRSILHGILQTLLMFGPKWADFLNSIVFVFYIWIIYKIANIKNKTKPSLLILIFFLIWFCQVNLGETTLWLSGSANYLWGTSIILTFIYPYHKYLIESLSNNRSLAWYEKSDNIIIKVLFVFLGIVAGWTNENMALALITYIALVILIQYRKKIKIEKWALYGLVGVIIGCIIMYIAPGNRVRYRLRLQALGISNPPPKSFYYENIHSWLNLISDNLLVIFIIIILLLFLFVFISKSKIKSSIILVSGIFILCSIIATLVLIVAPEFSDRMLFGVISLFIIVISLIYSHLNINSNLFKIFTCICCLILSIYFLNTYKLGRSYLKEINNIVLNREKQIYEQKSEGKQNIVLHSQTFDYRSDLIIPRIIDLPITEDSTLWMNQAYCRYYGIKSKKIIIP